MAPELIKRQPTDQRLDIFSYAVTCFEMYAKRFPWDAALTIDAVLQHINKPPVEITTLMPGIDRQVAAAIMKGLKANPDERWQTVGEMVGEIRDAEVRLVKQARDAAAAKAKASGAAPVVPATSSARQSDPTVAPATMPGNSSAAPSAKPVARPPAKPGKTKKRSADDDIDLTAMFAE
jgi:hypothetical protein